MTKTKILAALAACALVLSGCADMGQKEGIGTATGAALGGLLGAQIGHGTGRLAATAAGAVLGGMVGGSVGRSMDEQDRMRAAQVLETSRTGSTVQWHNPDTGASYAMTPTKTYENPAGAPCREYTTQAIIGGQTQTVYGTACRQPDGSWQIVQ